MKSKQQLSFHTLLFFSGGVSSGDSIAFRVGLDAVRLAGIWKDDSTSESPYHFLRLPQGILMRLITAILATCLLLVSNLHADVIKPVDVRGTSQFGLGLNLENLVNGDQGANVDLASIGQTHYGLIPAGGPGVLDDEHGITVGGAGSTSQFGWISGCFDGGIPGADFEDPNGLCSNIFAVAPTDDQIVEFEFDGSYDLTNMHIWNDNEDGFALDRGLDEFEIQVSPTRTGNNFSAVGSTYNLTPDDGFSNNTAQVIPLVSSGVRRVRLLLNSSHAFDPNTESYVGLAEVRFEGTLVTQDLAADHDNSGTVDAGDFLILQRNAGLGEADGFLNSTLSATRQEGDYDNNNVINQGDFTAWGGEYGMSSLGAATASVPEPTTMLIGLGTFLQIIAVRRYRSRVITEDG